MPKEGFFMEELGAKFHTDLNKEFMDYSMSDGVRTRAMQKKKEWGESRGTQARTQVLQQGLT